MIGRLTRRRPRKASPAPTQVPACAPKLARAYEGIPGTRRCLGSTATRHQLPGNRRTARPVAPSGLPSPSRPAEPIDPEAGASGPWATAQGFPAREASRRLGLRQCLISAACQPWARRQGLARSRAAGLAELCRASRQLSQAAAGFSTAGVSSSRWLNRTSQPERLGETNRALSTPPGVPRAWCPGPTAAALASQIGHMA